MNYDKLNSLQLAIEGLKKIFLPQDFVGFLRIVVSSLALLSLLNHALEHEFSKTLEVVVKSYDDLIYKLMSPFVPVVNKIVDLIRGVLLVPIDPQPYWRHLFLVLGVYFFSRLRAAITGRRWLTATFRFLWGLLVGLTTAILVSSVEINLEDSVNGIVVCALGVLGILLYEIGINLWFATFLRKYQAIIHRREVRSWWSEFWNLSVDDFIRALTAIVFCILLITLTPIGEFPEPGVFAFGVVIFLYGVFWIYWASRRYDGLRDLVVQFSSKDDSDAAVGFSIVNIFMWTVTCVALDSGSQIIAKNSFI